MGHLFLIRTGRGRDPSCAVHGGGVIFRSPLKTSRARDRRNRFCPSFARIPSQGSFAEGERVGIKLKKNEKMRKNPLTIGQLCAILYEIVVQQRKTVEAEITPYKTAQRARGAGMRVGHRMANGPPRARRKRGAPLYAATRTRVMGRGYDCIPQGARNGVKQGGTADGLSTVRP